MWRGIFCLHSALFFFWGTEHSHSVEQVFCQTPAWSGRYVLSCTPIGCYPGLALHYLHALLQSYCCSCRIKCQPRWNLFHRLASCIIALALKGRQGRQRVCVRTSITSRRDWLWTCPLIPRDGLNWISFSLVLCSFCSLYENSELNFSFFLSDICYLSSTLPTSPPPWPSRTERRLQIKMRKWTPWQAASSGRGGGTWIVCQWPLARGNGTTLVTWARAAAGY
jgi:hypothetical protein